MIAIISDVHGNYPALRAVLAATDALGIEQIISLGDIAGYYSMINECVDVLRNRAIVNLMGNHDHYLVNNVACPRSKSANASLEWQRREISLENLAWLAQSRLGVLRSGKLSMVHAGWDDPIDEYVEVISAEYFAGREGEVFVSGHTHVQGIWPAGDKTYCNPGSVGQPRDGDQRAAFAIWDDSGICLHRVDYDIDEITAHMRAAGFGAHFYENLRMGTRIGGKLSQIRVA